MTDYRRSVLMDAQPNTENHAGLWLDKFLKDDFKGGTDKMSSKELLVTEAAGMKLPEAYRSFYARWERSLKEICGDKNCRNARTLGRLAVNLGSESVLETSIALHRTYGVPFIPGSALKGLAAHYVMHYLQKDPRWVKDKGDGYVTLFGTTEEAGFVHFYDALYVPDSGKDKRALWKDVITVHHPDYYQGKKPEYMNGKDAPPADWDSPTPIPFLTANGSFLIALSGPSDEWVQKAFEILELALCREGIGAKTNSGYGRMEFVDKPKFSCQGEDKSDASDDEGASYAMRKKSLLQETPPAGRFRGTVIDVREGRYGKVNPALGGRMIGIHANQVRTGGKTLRDGMVVEYRIGKFKGNDQVEDIDILLKP